MRHNDFIATAGATAGICERKTPVTDYTFSKRAKVMGSPEQANLATVGTTDAILIIGGRRFVTKQELTSGELRATRAEAALLNSSLPIEVKQAVMGELADLRRTALKKYEERRDGKFDIVHQIDQCARSEEHCKFLYAIHINELQNIKALAKMAMDEANKWMPNGQIPADRVPSM